MEEAWEPERILRLLLRDIKHDSATVLPAPALQGWAPVVITENYTLYPGSPLGDLQSCPSFCLFCFFKNIIQCIEMITTVVVIIEGFMVVYVFNQKEPCFQGVRLREHFLVTIVKLRWPKAPRFPLSVVPP